MNKRNKKEEKDNIIDLLKRKKRLEESTSVKTYLRWKKLSIPEQIYLEKKWRAYFKEVKATKAYIRYADMRDSMKSKDFDSIKKLHTEAKQQLDSKDFILSVPELECFDFFKKDQQVSDYKYLLIKIFALSKTNQKEFEAKQEAQKLFGK